MMMMLPIGYWYGEGKYYICINVTLFQGQGLGQAAKYHYA